MREENGGAEKTWYHRPMEYTSEKASDSPQSTLVRILREELDGFTVMRLGGQEGPVVAAGNRHVGAKERHGSPFLTPPA
jgi:hypothetical protein